MLNATDTEDKMIGPEMDRRRLAMIVVSSPLEARALRRLDDGLQCEGAHREDGADGKRVHVLLGHAAPIGHLLVVDG